MECRDIFLEAGMDLRKFQTSSKELRDLWRESGLSVEESSDIVLENDSLKVLGISWNTDTDNFYFDSKHLETFLEKQTNTKRFLLQVASRIFDPLGFLAPFTIIIKCLIQELWNSGLDWDDQISGDLNARWIKWCNDVKDIPKIKIPRYYFLKGPKRVIETIELHSFSDASLRAYATVVYLRIVYNDGSVHTNLVTAKSRVSPLKTLSLPRLELLGALLASRLSSRVSSSLKIPLEKHWWTDSTIAYFWIRKSPRDFKPFVKNRVEEIQKLTEPSRWTHCPGKENPADMPSRGSVSQFSQLNHSDFWWHGPKWLQEPKQCWPKSEELNVEDEKLEYRSRHNYTQQFEVIAQTEELLDLSKHSKLTKSLRITAWIKRFVWNTRNSPKKSGPLTGVELAEAENFWIKSTQGYAYRSEIKSLSKNALIHKESKIASFVHFLDEIGILRIKGRLDHSKFTFDEKHPILLPRSSKFTELIVRREHERVLHCGVDITLINIRKRFWIPKGRQLLKGIIGKCLICSRYSAKAANQITAPLPKDRVVESPPFSVCGIDFAGPIYVKEDIVVFCIPAASELHEVQVGRMWKISVSLPEEGAGVSFIVIRTVGLERGRSK
ncbi:uncharacterized protein LOC129233642 [Uloborus diversus]|uniref:uncharacterized protein LOC129233642 n=1 Tax=Uloborus diversus TaxID=327109 RepID=UPI0024092848|nr:uncharacterized protein LOC129233642 [Uloborus diversus]